MNKRMRKLLVSLGMVVVLGTGNAFADAKIVDSQLAIDLKTAMDPADDYAVFGNNVTTGTSHFDGTIAANDATIKAQIGVTSQVKGNNTSYIVKLNEASTNNDLFLHGNNLALDTDNHNIKETDQTYIWVKKSNGNEVRIAANKYDENSNPNGLKLFRIPKTELGAKTKITKTLENLETLSTTLTTKSGDKVVSIVNINADDLTGNGEFFNVDINKFKDHEGKDKSGVTVVNVTIPKEITSFKTGKKLRINGSDFADYDIETAGKVLFNFVTTDEDNKVIPYAGNLSFGMGGGVILAPSATVDIPNNYSGNFDGSVLCNIFRGNAAEMHQVEFNLIDKKYTDTPDTQFDDYVRDEETGDILPWGAIAGVVLSASGLFLVNRKDKDEE